MCPLLALSRLCFCVLFFRCLVVISGFLEPRPDTSHSGNGRFPGQEVSPTTVLVPPCRVFTVLFLARFPILLGAHNNLHRRRIPSHHTTVVSPPTPSPSLHRPGDRTTGALVGRPPEVQCSQDCTCKDYTFNAEASGERKLKNFEESFKLSNFLQLS